MKRRVLFGLVLALVLALAIPAAALADENEPQSAVSLANQQELNGSLQGNHAGSFFYATLDYPGDESLVTIDLFVAPADPVTIMGVGMNLYGQDGSLLGQGALVDNGHLQIQYSGSVPGQFLLQVFNYVDGTAVDYSLKVDGLPEVAMTAEEPVPANQPTDVTLVPPFVEQAGGELVPMAGTLAGSNAGAFVHYAVFYDTASPVTLTLHYFPADNIIADAVDLRVYDPNGEVAYRAQAVDSNGLLTLSFDAQPGVRYEVVVGNWDPNITIQYNIDASPAPAAVSIGG